MTNSHRYRIILADPAWDYEHWNDKTTDRPRHYDRLTINELCGLPVSEHLEDNAALFLWVPDWLPPKDGQQVLEAWGFTYRTKAWVWVKQRKRGLGLHMGMGRYTRANPEDCLLGVKGTMPVKDKGIVKVIWSPVREHSRKPDEQYDIIQRLYPDGKRLELFARRRHSPAWDVWGNQVESDLALPPRPTQRILMRQ